MSENVDEALAQVIARIPKDPRFPIDSLRVKQVSGLSICQSTFLMLHGSKFTASEVAIVFQRSPQSIEQNCRNLGVSLIKGTRGVRIGAVRQETARKANRVAQVRAPIYAQTTWAEASVIRSQASGPAGIRSEALRRYKPLQADVDLGWWLNEAILHKLNIKRLGPDGCSFIAGDPGVPGWSYCGEPRGRGCGVYCEEHAFRCRSVQQPGKDSTDGGQETEEGPSTGARVDDKGQIRDDHAGAKRSASSGGRRGNVRSERIQELEKAGHKPGRAKAGAKAARAR